MIVNNLLLFLVSVSMSYMFLSMGPFHIKFQIEISECSKIYTNKSFFLIKYTVVKQTWVCSWVQWPISHENLENLIYLLKSRFPNKYHVDN